ncbi:MAG: protein-disulfide reductase DsbD domain-containing protein [Maritimibacter sp.]
MVFKNIPLFALMACAPLFAVAEGMVAPHPALPKPAEVSVINGWRAEDGSHMAAIHVRLAPEWKTYWRAPGDAGIPPSFDWSGSQNWGDVAFFWPAPEVFETNGMTTFGHGGELILPMKIAPEYGDDIKLEGKLMMGVCRDICMPFEAQVSAILTTRPFDAKRDAPITRALALRPDTREEAQVSQVSCEATPIEDGMRITARLEMPSLGAKEHIAFELAQGDVWLSEAMSTRQGDTLAAYADAVPTSGAPFDVDYSALRFTVISQGRAVDIQGCD